MRATLVALAACAAPAPAPRPLASRVAPTPPKPRWIALGAVTDKKITVARLAGDHVERVAEVTGNAFGWLDPHTLSVLDIESRGTIVQRYDDGHPLGELVVTEAEWPEQIHLELVLGKGEIWLKKCVATNTSCEDSRRYLRVFPAPRTELEQLPAGADPQRAIDRDESEPESRPPEAPAPAGYTLRVTPEQVTCDDGRARSTFPPPPPDTVTQAVRSARWVSTSPPLYEVTLAIASPAVDTRVEHHYLRPCGAPLDGYAWLGDGMWAGFVRREHDAPPGGEVHYAGDWTFYAGDRALGALPGVGSLRSITTN